MDIVGSQKAVDDWIKNHGVRYFNELTNMAQDNCKTLWRTK